MTIVITLFWRLIIPRVTTLDLDLIPHGTLKGTPLISIVNQQRPSQVSLLVFLNAIVIGAQTDYSAQHRGQRAFGFH